MSLDLISIADGIVVPGADTGGGIYSEGRYLKSSMVSHGWYPERFWSPPENVVNSDESVVFIGCFEPCWGHCITDNLKFLWIFSDERWRENLANHKAVYVCSTSAKILPANFWDMLSCLGIKREALLEVIQPTRFRKVLLPKESFFSDDVCNERFCDERYYGTIQRICHAVLSEAKHPTRRIYFSRTGWKKGNPDFGEHNIERCFTKLGYEIVHPEELTFCKMVGMLRNCSHFASLEGSSAHNAVFLPRGAEVVIIKKADYENPYQKAINAIAKLNTRYISSHWSKLLFYHNAPYGGPFFLYVSRELSQFAGVPVHFGIVDFSKYFLCWSRFRVMNFIRRFPGWLKRRLFKWTGLKC